MEIGTTLLGRSIFLLLGQAHAPQFFPVPDPPSSRLPCLALHNSTVLPPPISPRHAPCRPTGPPPLLPPSFFFHHACAGPPFAPSFFSSSQSRLSTLAPPFLFCVVLFKMKCVGVTPSIRGCLVSTPGRWHAAGTGRFEAVPPLPPCSG
jgi:hypothetical protein